MNPVISSNLGFPRIGKNREWKKALESFWAGRLQEEQFSEDLKRIRLRHLQLQREKGIDLIPVNDFSLYDHMLDTAAMFGLVPRRFSYDGGPVSLSVYYAMARGNEHAAACEMTKWFNTNYHYIVPELNDARPALTENRPLAAYREARDELGIDGKPVIVGLYTFLKLSKGYESKRFPELVQQLLPLYAQIFRELEREGAQWVQIDEPSLVTEMSPEDVAIVGEIYKHLHDAAPRLNIMLQTYFDSLEAFPEIVQLPVQGIGLDFVHGGAQNLRLLQTYGFPADKKLGVGLVDGRNVWRSDYEAKLHLLSNIERIVPLERLILQPSCSLLHVPVSVDQEHALEPLLQNALAFAEEKLDEVAVLTKGANFGSVAISAELSENRRVLQAFSESPARYRAEVREELARIDEQPAARASGFAARRALQESKWKLPLLPTTTIGSFPQTAEIRQARQRWRKGEWTDERYRDYIREQIRSWIEIQEQVGLDVLVHGEFERTDMVEFFGEQLDGFAFTRNGWVQSYGSRCVKPPIIFGDVRYDGPMTVEETVYAQSLTSKPVKGMLTGPMTILNWSFVRDDLPREQVANQIALALRKEVEALESAGIEMIQVDEPALREGLPLKRQDWDAYLDWAVRAFRIATSTVKDTTQIHTHMCYCEFHDIIDAIRELDADVISIETSRSHGELIRIFEHHTYDKGIGLGVYDIHSPRVPAVAEMVEMIEKALRVLDPRLFWINPDCGLKTRGTEETVAALKHMVQAARKVRERYGQETA